MKQVAQQFVGGGIRREQSVDKEEHREEKTDVRNENLGAPWIAE